MLSLPVKNQVYPALRLSWHKPKALTDPAQYFDPKQPIPEPRTHSCLQKNKTVVKLSNYFTGKLSI